MDKALFAERFADASRAAVECARRYVEEALPDLIRYQVQLNSSYDGNRLHRDERVYPGDTRKYRPEQLARMELEPLVSLLWRNGTVPEWINLSVKTTDVDATVVGVMACGRFTANDSLLYHEREGRPPFHVLGPSIPPDSMRDHPERFSLWWNVTAVDSATFRRAAENAEKVRILAIEGQWCDDALLSTAAAFTRLVSLQLEGTAVYGPGLANLAVSAPIENLWIKGVGPHPLDLTGLSRDEHLRHLEIAGEPSELAGLDALATLKRVAHVAISVRALSDLGFARHMSQLQYLDVGGSRVSSLEPLAAARRLGHLSLRGTATSDLELGHLAHLPSLRTLDLSETPITDVGISLIARIPRLCRLWVEKTPVTDATLAAFSDAHRLDRIDVRGTRVTLEGVARLASARPDLHILADGWRSLPRRLRPNHDDNGES